MKIGICGIGFVGNAINIFFKNISYNVVLYDKYKQYGTLNDLICTDIVYLCLPTLYDNNTKTYNTNELDNIIGELNTLKYNGIILIKSTIIPTYCSNINNIYPNLYIVHNPEFLSAKTAIEDFSKQRHIILGSTPQSEVKIPIVKTFYEYIFPKATLSITSCEISSLTKLACNSFYAVKVQYFTEIYLLCQKLNIDYNIVRKMMLLNDWIHPNHTSIPGHDNTISFGGACLPKDINALNQYMILNDSPHDLIDSVINERNIMRND
jgi:UDPglucose 6-dehydrogenase